MLIRFIKHEELAELLQLYRELNPADPEITYDERLEQEWNRIFGDPNLHYFVAEIDGRLAGSCMLAVIPNLTRGARPFGVIQNVVTLPEYRGRGVGTKLLDYANQFAWNRNCYQVLLQTGRPETHEFYRRVGYRDDVKTGFVAKPEWADR